MTTAYTTMPSPIGELMLVGDGERLSGIHLQAGRYPQAAEPGWRRDDAVFAAAGEQLERYFAGELSEFELDLDLPGTEFQRLVWRRLERIGFGETVSYAELAKRIGRPGAARAVGAANGRNPIAIVVPCHRVIGADGTLTGYAGGIEAKRLLLELERRTTDAERRPYTSTGGSAEPGSAPRPRGSRRRRERSRR
jgi:methylated-DNA-[protein]-cysteine S-methyltransferase